MITLRSYDSQDDDARLQILKQMEELGLREMYDDTIERIESRMRPQAVECAYKKTSNALHQSLLLVIGRNDDKEVRRQECAKLLKALQRKLHQENFGVE